MNAIPFISLKPYCRILSSCRNSSFFGFPPAKCQRTMANNSSKFRLNFDYDSHYPFRKLGFPRIIYETQKVFVLPSSNFGQSRVILRSFCLSTTSKGISLVARVASRVRDFSTSVETRGNDNNFDRTYIQGGKNVKPPVIERINEDEHIVAEEKHRLEVGCKDVNIENSIGLNLSEDVSSKTRGQETDIEKEAWKLLQNAVVTYCGSPVGTLAANDPGDKQPLNYDQVFIRDFVPSALAFLLRGEKEIVKNFLIHNLQLQWMLIILGKAEDYMLNYDG